MAKENEWVPLDINLVSELPNRRPYTKLEAMFSHQRDLYLCKSYSIKGYAKLWQWSRNKVRKFLTESASSKGHPLEHSKDTLWTLSGHTVHLITLQLQNQKDTSRTLEGHLKDTPPTPTIKSKEIEKEKENNRSPKNGDQYTPLFESFWELQKNKVGKGAAFTAWRKAIQVKRVPAEKIIASWQEQMEHYQRRQAEHQTSFPHPSTWLNECRWDDDPASINSNGKLIGIIPSAGIITGGAQKGGIIPEKKP